VVEKQSVPLVSSLTVVLPQRYRASVVDVVPYGHGSILILLKDFVVVADKPPEPIWRLFRYEAPATTAVEVCTFSQAGKSGVFPVHIACVGTDVYLLFHNELLRVDVDEKVVHGVCRLHLPQSEDEQAGSLVRALAMRAGTACLTVELGEENLTLHWIPLDDRPVVGCRFRGVRGERILFGPNDDLYALDMLDLTIYRNGEWIGHRDLTDCFDEWYRNPLELLSIAPDGRVFVANGTRMVAVAPDLSRIVGTYALPTVPTAIKYRGDSEALLATVDPVSCTLLIQTVKV